jgi:hypothetical protein
LKKTPENQHNSTQVKQRKKHFALARIPSQTVAEVLRDVRGNLSVAAQKIGVDRTTMYNYIESHPELKEVLKEARETMLDHAESSLYRAVLDGEGWGVCFLLKTQGKSRGYIERQELTGAEGFPLMNQTNKTPLEELAELLAKRGVKLIGK